MWACATDISDSDVEEARPAADRDDVQRDGPQIGVLARVVAADCRRDGIGRLATDHKSVVLADTRPRSVEVEFEEVQPELADIRLASHHRHRTGTRVGERRRSSRIPEVGSIEVNCLAAANLNCCHRRVTMSNEEQSC